MPFVQVRPSCAAGRHWVIGSLAHSVSVTGKAAQWRAVDRVRNGARQRTLNGASASEGLRRSGYVSQVTHGCIVRSGPNGRHERLWRLWRLGACRCAATAVRRRRRWERRWVWWAAGFREGLYLHLARQRASGRLLLAQLMAGELLSN